MPQLPQYLARQPLPSTSGQQRGVRQVPVGAEPLARDTGPNALEQALGDVGEGTQQLGGQLLQTEELKARQQKAQDFLDGRGKFQDFRPALRTKLEELKQGSAYQTLPADFLEQADRLIDEYGSGLSEQARRQFTVQAKAERAALHLEATQQSTLRRDNAMTMATMTEVQWTQDNYNKATTDFERAYHWDSLQGLLTGAVEHGLMKGDIAAKILGDTDKGLQVGQAKMATRADPASAVQDLGSLLQGGTAKHPAFQDLPQTVIADLYDDATRQLHTRVVAKEADRTRHHRELQQQQGLRAGEYRKALASPDVSIPYLLSLLDPIDEDFRAQRLDENHQKELLGQTRILIDKLREDEYKDRDISTVAKDGILRVQTAQTPADLDAARLWVDANKDNLSRTTMQQMYTQIDQRADKADPLNNDQAKEARRVFLAGAFPGGIIPAVMDKIDDGVKSKTAAGLALLNGQLRKIYETEGRAAMEAQAVTLGEHVKQLYFPASATQQGPTPAGWPVFLQGVPYLEDAVTALDGSGVTGEVRRRLFMEIKETLPRRPVGPAVTGTTPKVPELAKVPGVKLPSKPYPTLENR